RAGRDQLGVLPSLRRRAVVAGAAGFRDRPGHGDGYQFRGAALGHLPDPLIRSGAGPGSARTSETGPDRRIPARARQEVRGAQVRRKPRSSDATGVDYRRLSVVPAQATLVSRRGRRARAVRTAAPSATTGGIQRASSGETPQLAEPAERWVGGSGMPSPSVCTTAPAARSASTARSALRIPVTR